MPAISHGHGVVNTLGQLEQLANPSSSATV